MTNYQRCAVCVMDTTDPQIVFDQNGVCNHCLGFRQEAPHVWHPNDRGVAHIRAWAARVKEENKNNEYDCIMGLSGGTDSTFMAVQAHRLGLRPLVVHVDTGWNSELAVKNIENVVRKLGFDLHTEVIDWGEMKDLQIAFLRAGLANQDTPQDHAIFGTLYKLAISSGIKHLLSGINYATECILPRAWGHNALDGRQLRAVHKRFGKRPLATFPVLSFSEYCSYQFRFPQANFESFPILNFMPYSKAAAMEFLQSEYGFRDYGAKHYESRFTKFFQSYFLPVKFGYDKRLAHLSSLVVTGQMSRAEALEQLGRPPFKEAEIEEDKTFFIKKLGLTPEEFEAIMQAPNRSFQDYPNHADNIRQMNEIRSGMSQLHTDMKALQERWNALSAATDA
ncbi:N-acetyl sugar amidotransferase (plasmid) [Azospirillum sp. TSA2s]|nr:N-acetyl sugar amidotransferase [Azospirillum sp. TSA2s]